MLETSGPVAFLASVDLDRSERFLQGVLLLSHDPDRNVLSRPSSPAPCSGRRPPHISRPPTRPQVGALLVRPSAPPRVARIDWRRP